MSTVTATRKVRTAVQADAICRLAERHIPEVERLADQLKTPKTGRNELVEVGMDALYELADQHLEAEWHGEKMGRFTESALPKIEAAMMARKEANSPTRKRVRKQGFKTPSVRDLPPLPQERKKEMEAFRREHGGVETVLKVLREEKIDFRMSLVAQLAYYMSMSYPTARSRFRETVLAGKVTVERNGQHITNATIVEAN